VIVATPKSAGSYKDTGDVAVPTGITDTDAANNTAATTLNVTAPGTALKCVVPKLGGASSSLAKQVLPLLGCKVGKTKKAHSKSVAKGLLIGTSPGAGTYAAYKAVGLEVSSGPAPKKAKKVKKKKK
jgi:beta-lactam-binding protein with PASTA domain